jgi:hypothetical protein
VKQQVVLPKATAESFYSCAFKLTKQVLTRRHESFGVNTRQVRPPQLAASFIAARNGVTSSVMLVSDFGPLRATLTPDDVTNRIFEQVFGSVSI